MKLFPVLFRRRNLPSGNIWTGKDRLIKQVIPSDVQKLKNQFEIEEKNMFLLRHAYLTPEQSFGHAKALDKHQKRMDRLIGTKKEFRDNVTIESRLSHLKYQEAWD